MASHDNKQKHGMSTQILSSGFDCCLSWFAQLCLVSEMFDPWMEWIITAVTGFQMPCPDTRWVPVNPQDIGVIGAPVTMALVQHQKPSTSLLKQNNISFTFIFMARVLCIDSYNFHLCLTTSSTSHKLSSLQLSSCCFYLNYKHPEFSTSTFPCLTHLEADGTLKSISLHLVASPLPTPRNNLRGHRLGFAIATSLEVCNHFQRSVHVLRIKMTETAEK